MVFKTWGIIKLYLIEGLMKQAIFLFFCVVFLATCSKNSHPDYFGTVKPNHPADEIVINAASEPQYLDPTKVSDSTSRILTSSMFSRLTQSDPKGGREIPDLAERWELSKDGREYTFYIRKDALWSDGQPLTAHDVEYSWKRLMDPKTGSTYNSMADVIENAREYRTGKISADKVSLKAKDDHTLWVRLVSPVPYFLGLIEYMVFAPVPKHVVEKFTKENKVDLWVRPENIVVSGPFILAEENFKQYKIYKKNPKYFDAHKVRINRVKAVMIEDYLASVNAFKTGQHDWTAEASIPSDMIEKLKKYRDFNFDPMLSTYFYFFNTKKKPMDDVRVRLAMSLAIDRKSIVDNVARQGQKPSRDLVPDGIEGYQGPESSLYDPALAKSLLADAGFPDGKGFPKLTLKFNTSDNHKKIAEAVQGMWKQVLGIHVDISNLEWRILLDDQTRGDFDIVRYSWTADYMDPHTFLSVMMSESENNKSRWKNKKYDELIIQSDLEQNQQKRFVLLKEAEKILAAESPIIPFYFYTRAYLKKPYLKGFWPQYQDHHEWKYFWIDERWYKGVPENLEVENDQPWTE
jgi:oligopeptide transport system substrate-binding protein